jgi:hypothetical protein
VRNLSLVWKIVSGAAFLLLAWAIFTPSSVDHLFLRQAREAPRSIESHPASQTPIPNLVIHPYDVLQNPFKFQNKVVVFDVIARPRFYDGRFFEYADGIIEPGTQLAATGLQFRKILSNGVGLYALQGVDPSFVVSIGELVVIGANQELRTDRLWEVEPLGTAQSTNYPGAAPEMPVVKFWAYVNEVNNR